MSNNAIIFISLCGILSLVSFLIDRRKTWEGFKRGWRMFRNMLLPFINTLILVSLVIYFISPDVISQYLGAGIGNIFINLGAFTSMKLPMLGIEIGYLGIEYTITRTLVSLPLFIGIGYLMESLLKNKNFEVNDGSREPR